MLEFIINVANRNQRRVQLYNIDATSIEVQRILFCVFVILCMGTLVIGGKEEWSQSLLVNRLFYPIFK